jgi:hypothetical protein
MIHPFIRCNRLQKFILAENEPCIRTYSQLMDEIDDEVDESGRPLPQELRVAKLLSHVQAEISSFLKEVQNKREDGNLAPVSRIFLPNLADIAVRYGDSESGRRLIARFVLGLKHLIRDTNTTVTVTLQPQTCSQLLSTKLKWLSDTVLTIDTFAGRQQSVPYEFREFCGLLTIEKVQQVGTIASFRPPGSKFGLKRDSRKLHVEPLHLPPEESRAVGGGGCTSGLAAVAASASVMASNDHAGAGMNAVGSAMERIVISGGGAQQSVAAAGVSSSSFSSSSFSKAGRIELSIETEAERTHDRGTGSSAPLLQSTGAASSGSISTSAVDIDNSNSTSSVSGFGLRHNTTSISSSSASAASSSSASTSAFVGASPGSKFTTAGPTFIPGMSFTRPIGGISISKATTKPNPLMQQRGSGADASKSLDF